MLENTSSSHTIIESERAFTVKEYQKWSIEDFFKQQDIQWKEEILVDIPLNIQELPENHTARIRIVDRENGFYKGTFTIKDKWNINDDPRSQLQEKMSKQRLAHKVAWVTGGGKWRNNIEYNKNFSFLLTSGESLNWETIQDKISGIDLTIGFNDNTNISTHDATVTSEWKKRKRTSYVYKDLEVSFEENKLGSWKMDIEYIWEDTMISPENIHEKILHFAEQRGVIGKESQWVKNLREKISNTTIDVLDLETEANMWHILFSVSNLKLMKWLMKRSILKKKNDTDYSHFLWILDKYFDKDDGTTGKSWKRDFRKFDRKWGVHQEAIMNMLSQWFEKEISIGWNIQVWIQNIYHNLLERSGKIFLIFSEKVPKEIFTTLLNNHDQLNQIYDSFSEKLQILMHPVQEKWYSLKNFSCLMQKIYLTTYIQQQKNKGIEEQFETIIKRHFDKEMQTYEDLLEFIKEEPKSEYIKEFLSKYRLYTDTKNIFYEVFHIVKESNSKSPLIKIDKILENPSDNKKYIKDIFEDLKMINNQEKSELSSRDLIIRKSNEYKKLKQQFNNIQYTDIQRLTHRALLDIFILQIKDIEWYLKLTPPPFDTSNEAYFREYTDNLYKKYYQSVYLDNGEMLYSQVVKSQLEKILGRLEKWGKMKVEDFLENYPNDFQLLFGLFIHHKKRNANILNNPSGWKLTIHHKLEELNIKWIPMGKRFKNTSWESWKSRIQRAEHRLYHMWLNTSGGQMNFIPSSHEWKKFVRQQNLYLWNTGKEGINEHWEENSRNIKTSIGILNSLLAGQDISHSPYYPILIENNIIHPDGGVHEYHIIESLIEFLKFVYHHSDIIQKMELKSQVDYEFIQTGLSSHDKSGEKYSHICQEIWAKILTLGGFKTRQRIIEKYFDKYEGDGAQKLWDLVRGRFIFPTYQDSLIGAAKLVAYLKKEKIWKSVSIEWGDENLLMKAQKWSGYRDIVVTIKLASGNNVELQLITEDILVAKEKGYSLIQKYQWKTLKEDMKEFLGNGFDKNEWMDIKEHLEQHNTSMIQEDKKLKLPREFRELFADNVLINEDEKYFVPSEQYRMSWDMFYDLYRNITKMTKLRQKLERLESMLYDVSMGRLLKKEYINIEGNPNS